MGILSTNHKVIGVANGGGGKEYTAGDYIKIDNDEISVTGLVPQTEYSAFSSHMTACCNEVSGTVNNIYTTVSGSSAKWDAGCEEYSAGAGIKIQDHIIAVKDELNRPVSILKAGTGLAMSANADNTEYTMFVKDAYLVLTGSTDITATFGTGSICKPIADLNAYVPDGYKFGSWLSLASWGWVGSVYAEYPDLASCRAWGVYSCEDKSTLNNDKIGYTYLVIKV